MAAWNPEANAIFLKAMDIQSPDGRQVYLDEVCDGDAQLRGQVEDLLRASERAGTFLESPAPGVTALKSAELSEQVGSVIGPYKLLEQIGEGGMGVVYMADQQTPVRRRVAIKIIKPGMDTRQVIARFEAERQALALMDHPNIARVLDVGATESSRPYFVMELVRGVPITDYCDRQRLTSRERLVLFIDVCHAVQHAHQKGVIHRDLKPSNVMVTMHDDKPVPKIIDFGVLKAIGQQFTEKTLFTAYGEMIGTPMYMSPEQAQLSGLDVDTRSDVYSLGVLLYELVTGTTPFDEATLKRAGFNEMRRMIHEDEPLNPSARVGTLKGDRLSAIADERNIDPHKLSQTLRGEVDWVVMKALEKDRNRRYDSANSFAQDVQRYLNDEPVQACPPSTWYRFRKLARRNRALLATATLMALAALIATGSLVVGHVRIRSEVRQKEMALAAAQRSEQNAVANLNDAMAAVDQMLTRVAEERLLSVPQMEPLRRELLEDALKFYQRFLDQKADSPVLRRKTAMACRRIAQLYNLLGQHAEAEQLYQKAFAMFDALAAESRLEPDVRNMLAGDHIEFANALEVLGKRDDYEKHLRLALQMAKDLVKEFPSDPEQRELLATANRHLISLLTQTRPVEAERLLRRSLTLNASPGAYAQTCNQLAAIALKAGRYTHAEQDYRAAIGFWEKAASESPAAHWLQIEAGAALLGLADVIAAQGRLEEAEDFSRRAITTLDKTASDHPSLPNYRRVQLEARSRHLDLLKKLNRSDEAEAACRRDVDLLETLAGDSPQYWQRSARSRAELGRLLLTAGKKREADKIFDQALAVEEKREAEFGKDAKYRRDLALSHGTTAGALSSAGRTNDALRLCNLALAQCRSLADERPAAAEQLQLANLYRELGQCFPQGHEEETAFRLALETRERVLAISSADAAARWTQGHDHRYFAFASRREPGRYRETEAHFLAALELFGAIHAEFPERADYRTYLVETLDELKRLLATSPDSDRRTPRKALELAEKGVALGPDAWQTWSLRGAMFAELGQWTKASDDFEKASTLNRADPLVWHRLALLRLQSGDRDGYRRACGEMSEHTNASANLDAAYWTVWTCALAPDAVASWQPVVQSAEKLVAADPKRYDWQIALAAVLYRAGRFEEAATRLTKVETAFNKNTVLRSSIASNGLVQAMTQDRLGHAEEAKKWLAKAIKDIDLEPQREAPDLAATHWEHRLTLQLLRREAEEQLKNEPKIRAQ